jgi:hypothetical protein
MTNITIEELQSENQRLRDLVVLLSARLVGNLVLAPPSFRRNVSSSEAAQLLEEAEICFRCASISRLEKEITEALGATGDELMAKAIEVETKLQREKWKK